MTVAAWCAEDPARRTMDATSNEGGTYWIVTLTKRWCSMSGFCRSKHEYVGHGLTREEAEQAAMRKAVPKPRVMKPFLYEESAAAIRSKR